MKKLIVTAAFILSGISLVLANTGKALNFSGSKHFKTTYPNATMVSYKTVDQYVAVSFTSDNNKMEAFYNNQGALVAQSKNIQLSDLPSGAAETINKKYDGWNKAEVIEYDNLTDETSCYYVSLTKDSKKIILQVDKDGHTSLFQQ